MIWALVIYACTTPAPDVVPHCGTYEQPLTEIAVHPAMAFVQAQTLLAQWKEKHPGLKVDRWRLEPGKGT